jgi:hypothetical protein
VCLPSCRGSETGTRAVLCANTSRTPVSVLIGLSKISIIRLSSSSRAARSRSNGVPNAHFDVEPLDRLQFCDKLDVGPRKLRTSDGLATDEEILSGSISQSTVGYPHAVAPAARRIAMTPSCIRLVAHARGVAHGSSSARFVAAPQASNSSTMSGSPREWGRTIVVVLCGDRRASVEQDRRGGVKPGRGRFCARILIASRFPSQRKLKSGHVDPLITEHGTSLARPELSGGDSARASFLIR